MLPQITESDPDLILLINHDIQLTGMYGIPFFDISRAT